MVHPDYCAKVLSRNWGHHHGFCSLDPCICRILFTSRWYYHSLSIIICMYNRRLSTARCVWMLFLMFLWSVLWGTTLPNSDLYSLNSDPYLVNGNRYGSLRSRPGNQQFNVTSSVDQLFDQGIGAVS